MGAAALVVESAAAARERGLTPICEVLGTITANCAFHGTRLDVDHIGGVMERVVSRAERRGVRREEIAGETMFVSHETYTPARGGSAAAEIHALRQVFGDGADRIVIANVKGLTGHPMGVGLEDVLAVKALETGIVPPVPNFSDVDPELGELYLRGGAYPIALRATAGGRVRLADLDDAAALDAGRRRAQRSRRRAWLRVQGRRSRGVDAWLRRVSGQEDPQLEVVTRTLRVVDAQAPPGGSPRRRRHGRPRRPPRPSRRRPPRRRRPPPQPRRRPPRRRRGPNPSRWSRRRRGLGPSPWSPSSPSSPWSPSSRSPRQPIPNPGRPHRRRPSPRR